MTVQVTWLDSRSHRRFRRMNLSALGLGAVRLAAATATLGLVEGIETGLAAMQIHGVPVWATLGRRMANVFVPDTVQDLIIFADNGQAGRDAAESAMQRHTRKGRCVVVHFPPANFKDWADVTAAQRA
jgi:putative DNA primase/helicase